MSPPTDQELRDLYGLVKFGLVMGAIALVIYLGAWIAFGFVR
jgi:hypothetical protein